MSGGVSLTARLISTPPFPPPGVTDNEHPGLTSTCGSGAASSSSITCSLSSIREGARLNSSISSDLFRIPSALVASYVCKEARVAEKCQCCYWSRVWKSPKYPRGKKKKRKHHFSSGVSLVRFLRPVAPPAGSLGLFQVKFSLFEAPVSTISSVSSSVTLRTGCCISVLTLIYTLITI